MRKTIYLVDTENLNVAEWTKCLDKLSSMDEIILFYTDKSPRIRLGDELSFILMAANHITQISCINGTDNALDMQLAVWLGRKSVGSPKTRYVICSNDHGYDVIIPFLQSLDVCVERRPLKNGPKLLPAPVEKPAPVKHINAEADIKEPYTTLPPGAASFIGHFVKVKYHNEKNFLLMFNALVDGSDKKIRECAETIADNKKDATHLFKAMKNVSKSRKVQEFEALLKEESL